MRLPILALLITFGLSLRAEEPKTYTQLIFVKIPESILPIERGKKYEDPIDSSLKKLGIGEVGGGGTMLAKNKKDIEWVGVDIYVSDISLSLPSVKKVLHKHRVPYSSTLELHYPDRIEEITLGPPETFHLAPILFIGVIVLGIFFALFLLKRKRT